MKTDKNLQTRLSSQYLIWLFILIFLGLTLLANQGNELKKYKLVQCIHKDHVCKHNQLSDYLIFHNYSYSAFSKLERDK